MNKQYIKYFGLLISLILIGVGGFVLFQNFTNNKITWKQAPTDLIVPTLYYSALDGSVVSSSEQINPSVVGVMIDNHPFSRPQSGLNAAKVVYEAPAEGGVTRYLAIFDSLQEVEKVGPVRSARPYFLEWIKEYSGLYMHCGGSPEALSKIENENLFALNEFFNGQYYWRDNNHEAPHNLFTNSDNWNKYLAESERVQSIRNGWVFGNINSVTSSAVSAIEIQYDSNYSVEWKYNVDSALYHRYVNGKVQQEDTVVLMANNVIVQYVRSKVLDDYGRKEIATDGQGEVRLLRDGKMIIGIWKKENDRTRFYDLAGTELNLKAGKIWVQIVPNEVSLKITT